MDTARAAKRNAGVKKVSLVYRRTKRYMPADAEELEMAIEDGVEFAELLAPVKLENGVLILQEDGAGRYGRQRTQRRGGNGRAGRGSRRHGDRRCGREGSGGIL